MFDDFGGAAMGNWGRRLTYVTVYATILAEPVIFHLTSMEALQQIFYRAGVTQKFAALVVTAVMIPLAQVLPVNVQHPLSCLYCPVEEVTDANHQARMLGSQMCTSACSSW